MAKRKGSVTVVEKPVTSFFGGLIDSSLTAAQKAVSVVLRPKKAKAQPKRPALYDDDDDDDDDDDGKEVEEDDLEAEEPQKRLPAAPQDRNGIVTHLEHGEPATSINGPVLRVMSAGARAPAEIEEEGKLVNTRMLMIDRLMKSPTIARKRVRAGNAAGTWEGMLPAQRIELIIRSYGPKLKDELMLEQCIRCSRLFRGIDNYGHWECWYHPGDWKAEAGANGPRWSCCNIYVNSDRGQVQKGCFRCDHSINHISPADPLVSKMPAMLLPVLKPLREAVQPLPQAGRGRELENMVLIRRAVMRSSAAFSAFIEQLNERQAAPASAAVTRTVYSRPVFRTGNRTVDSRAEIDYNTSVELVDELG